MEEQANESDQIFFRNVINKMLSSYKISRRNGGQDFVNSQDLTPKQDNFSINDRVIDVKLEKSFTQMKHVQVEENKLISKTIQKYESMINNEYDDISQAFETHPLQKK